MTAQTGNNENAERGLLPYPVIIAATKGDPEAMAIVVKHYESYITSLSMRKLYDERGNVYWGIDEDIRDRLRSRLMGHSNITMTLNYYAHATFASAKAEMERLIA